MLPPRPDLSEREEVVDLDQTQNQPHRGWDRMPLRIMHQAGLREIMQLPARLEAAAARC